MTLPSRVDQLLSAIVADNPMQRGLIDVARASLDAPEAAELSDYVDFCAANGAPLEEVVRSYRVVVEDTLREQLFFRRHRRYRHQRFADVAGSVYFSPEYMGRYMRGLAVTSFLWPNHAAIRHHFEWTLDRLPGLLGAGPRSGRYLEVGPGHGFYMAAAMRRRVCRTYLGVDLSPTSVALTREMLARTRSDAAWEVREADFSDATLEGPFDLVVMGEVLEHVEDPLTILRRARALTAPSGITFLTTCANSPATDHIYLFRNADEVDALCARAGFQVVERLVLPYHGKTIDESIAEALPVNIALVLRP